MVYVGRHSPRSGLSASGLGPPVFGRRANTNRPPIGRGRGRTQAERFEVVRPPKTILIFQIHIYYSAVHYVFVLGPPLYTILFILDTTYSPMLYYDSQSKRGF